MTRLSRAIALASLGIASACSHDAELSRNEERLRGQSGSSPDPGRPGGDGPSPDVPGSQGGGGSDEKGPDSPALVARFDYYGFNGRSTFQEVSNPERGVLQNDDGAPPGSLTDERIETRRRGEIVFGENGTFRYTPAGRAEFWGDDSFEYVVRNGRSEARASVRLTVSPGAVPLASGAAVDPRTVIARAGGALSSASVAGDVDGDGWGDLLVSHNDARDAESVCVVLGKAFRDAPRELSNCDTNAFLLFDVSQNEHTVSGAGDLNGDGFDDLLIGDASFDLEVDDRGAVYVVFGSADPAPVDLDIIRTVITSDVGFPVFGEALAGGSFGKSIASIGDFNGDGVGDFIVGAPGVGDTGAAYVIFGARGQGGVLNLALTQIPEMQPLAIVGSTAVTAGNPVGRIGEAVAGAGDVNGDGLSDVVLGSANSSLTATNTGTVYVVFGKEDRAPVPLRDIELGDPRGFAWAGSVAGAHAGASVSGAGDFDADGDDDIIYAAIGQTEPTRIAGAAYVLLGRPGDGAAAVAEGVIPEFSVSIGELPTAPGTAIVTAGAGDQNGDGNADVMVALPTDSANAGVVVTLLGERVRRPRSLVAILEGRDPGAIFTGNARDDWSGASVSGGVDMDHDGLDDAIVSTGKAGSAANTAYILFGWDMLGSIREREQVWIGTREADRWDLGPEPLLRVHAGNGLDTLVWDGAELDLRGRASAIVSVEEIDLTAPGATVLFLDDIALRRIPRDRSDLPIGVAKALVVRGDAQDRVEWSSGLTGANGAPETFEARDNDLWVRTGKHYGLKLSGGVTANLPVAPP